MLEIILWLFVGLIFYCYLGYPVCLWLVAKVRGKEVRKRDALLSVSVVLSVWNEEDVIAEKIRNLLSLDYPLEKMEILIASDGSTDRTDEIVRGVPDERVRLFENSGRRGKPAALNDLLQHSRHEIIVFTDARQSFARDAVRELVRNFADERVGCVSGELVFAQTGGGTAKGINVYWDYEKGIRALESRIHSMLGATGAIYAIRKELFVNVPKDIVLDDMFVPLKIVEKGFRAIFDESAKAYDKAADSPREEHSRKARTLYGNYQIFKIFSHLFNVFKSPVAIQLFSHKFLRVVIPFLLIGVFLVNLILVGRPFYDGLFVAQVVFYLMAVAGGLARHKKYGILKFISRSCCVPYVFCLMNFSALMGFLRFVGSRQGVAWEKAREAVARDSGHKTGDKT
ncbi:MAG: glycosyltransferase family 2 protein [Candidatus Omnitrophica bacterium]|nr:glycosyltransferase family 2 protein [Candidatus Omnitrophota bacterium]